MTTTSQRVLFIGDSITDAFRKPDETNDAFQLGNGYVFLIASQLRFKEPKQERTFWNRGISGEALADIAARWEKDCLALRPTSVSILAGVNDTGKRFNGTGGSSIEEFADCYAQLLERTRNALPEVQLILCEPFLLPCGLVGDGWMEDIRARGQVVKELASQTGATFVPLQSAFDDALEQAPAPYWAYDGVHPTAAGFQLIARQWLRVVKLAN